MNPRFHEHVVSNSVGPNTLPCGTPSDRCSRSGGNPPLLLLSVDHHSGLRSAGLRGPQTEETPRSSGVVWSEGPTWRRRLCPPQTHTFGSTRRHLPCLLFRGGVAAVAWTGSVLQAWRCLHRSRLCRTQGDVSAECKLRWCGPACSSEGSRILLGSNLNPQEGLWNLQRDPIICSPADAAI